MELIDKNELLEKIEELEAQNHCGTSDFIESKRIAFNQVKQALNSIEVKEVDLDFQTFAKEMDAIFALPSSETKNTEENHLNWEYAIAKHFFELGVKAKGE